MSDVIFEPLTFRNLTVKNRAFRSNVAGRFDECDSSGSQVRINWELKFAEGGVGAILQLGHSGRQRDIPDLKYANGLSSIDRCGPFRGVECDRMTTVDIKKAVAACAEGAILARVDHDFRPQLKTSAVDFDDALHPCLAHVVEHPLGCYEEGRFPSREAMLEEVMSVFHPAAYS